MSDRTSQLESTMLRLVDVGLAATIFVAPFVMGGRGPVGKFVFIAAALFTAVAWSLKLCFTVRPAWRWSGAEWLLLLGLVLVLLQLAPLPSGILGMVSPAAVERLPLWHADSGAPLQLGQWSQVSLAPEETRAALMVYVAYALLFLVVVQRVETTADIERLMRWIASAAVLMAVVGLLQFLVGNGKFLWLYDHPTRSTDRVVRGTFQNQNHFAHFLALGLGPLIWWLWRTAGASPGPDRARAWKRSGDSGFRTHRSRSTRQNATIQVPWIVLAGAAGVLLTAGLLTFSRGGVIVLSLSALACVTFYFSRSLLGLRAFAAVAAISGAVLGALVIYGHGELGKKLASFANASSFEQLSSGRAALWSALFKAVPDFAALGSGIGSHRFVYPMYLDKYFDVDFTHGESGYLPLLLEAGVPGLVLMLLGLGMSLWWSARVLFARNNAQDTLTRNNELALAAAVLAGLVVSVVHSVGDFVWYISACMSLAVILAACGCRLHQLTRPAESDRTAVGKASSGPWLARAGFAALLLLTIVILRDRLPAAVAAPHWDRYRAISTQIDFAEMQGGGGADTQERVALMLRHLEQTVRHDPNHSQANVRLAALYLRAFDSAQLSSPNPMGLSQIRDAALASRFASREAQDEWLARAIGEQRQLLDNAQRHAMRGVRLSPLQGQVYTYLSELSFLNSPARSVKQSLLAQAERVRPYDGIVQFVIGRELLMEGRPEVAIEYWREAFHRDPEVQGLIVNLLASRVPAQLLVEQFQPEREALGRIFQRYRELDRPQEARVAGQHYLQAIIAGTLQSDAAQTSELWHQAASVYEFLGNGASAVECQRKAVERAPRDYRKRRTLGRLLLAQQRFDEAIEHLKWCSQRNPEDTLLQRELEAAAKQTLNQAPLSAKPPSELSEQHRR